VLPLADTALRLNIGGDLQNGHSRNTCSESHYIVVTLRQPQLPILRGDRLMLSFCIHHINMDNRSPAPLTTRGSPNHIARHQRGHHYKSLRDTTKAREASPARRNAKPRSRSCPARPQTITLDCPGHPGSHRATSLHAAAHLNPAQGSGANTRTAGSSTPPHSSSSHRPATRQASKS
jgi:hypothetical protein